MPPLLLCRSIHFKRIPNYKGYWTEILNRAVDPALQQQRPSKSDSARSPIPIPFIELNDNVQPIPDKMEKPKTVVYFKGKPIELLPKPEPPDNCCMSGCVHCVWDMYEEDIEEFQKEREDLRNRFIEAGEPIPEELQKSSNNMNEGETDIDPTMRAFLEMEKKLNNKN